MGIEIEFDHEDSGEQYSQLEESQTNLEVAAAAPDTPPQDENQPPRGRRRHNSDPESSVWDLGIKHQPQSRKRRNSFTDVADVRPEVQESPGFSQEVGPVQPAPNTAAPAGNQNAQVSAEDKVRPWLNSRSENPSKGRGKSVSTHGSMRIRRRSTSRAPAQQRHERNHPVPASEDYNAASELTAVTSDLKDDDMNIIESPESIQRNLVRPTSGSLMQIKASMILKHHLGYLVRRQLETWREKANQIRQDSLILDSVASSHDRRVLLQTALSIWRVRLQENRQISETDKFFSHLERRAKRARDLYLMHKSFTHWQACANIEVQRTALARRHIVRTRFFDAWREYTAVNQLKVRRHVLKKLFGAWQRKHGAVAADYAVAMQRYDDNLIEKVCREWVRRHWDVKAISWYAEKMKRQTLFRWIVATHNTWEDHRTAEEARRFRLSWNVWRIWRAKTNQRLQQNHEAETYYKTEFCRKALRKWRGETRVIPAKKNVQTDVRTRLLRETFGVWLKRTREEKRAAAVDRMRILREAWTMWRHKARSQLITARIDRRVVLESLFKWIPTERSVLTRKRLDTDLLRRSLQTWKGRLKTAREQRWDQEDLAQTFAVQKTQNFVFARWYSAMETRQRLENAASDFPGPRLLQGVLSQWSERTQHLLKLERWAQDADFYFLAMKSLKRWKASTESAKREKRKAAYAQVRRMTKMNLARAVLRNWQRQAHNLLHLEAQASEVALNKNVLVGMNVFDRWRTRMEEVMDLESLCQETVLKKHLAVWRERSNTIQDLNTEAMIAYEENQERRAVRKWSLQALQIRAQENYAADVREKNAKRTFRKLFTYWHQKAAQRRRLRPPDNQQSRQDEFGNTARAEAWSDFGEEQEADGWARGLDEATVSTLIPGYLNTPSRRSERVMAMATRFSTTPRAPLSTPFERQLRAQYSGGPLPSFRRGLGRSTLGMDRGFPDVADRSTNNDHRAHR